MSIADYQRKIQYVNHNDLPAQVLEHFGKRAMLLPASYPIEQFGKRRALTASMWSKYGGCQQAFKLAYVERMVRRSPRLPLRMGTFWHAVVGGLFSGAHPRDPDYIAGLVAGWVGDHETQWSKLSRSGDTPKWSIEDLREAGRAVEAMARAWCEHPDDLVLVALNVRGRVPLRHPSTGRRSPLWDYVFEWDALVRDRASGMLWVHEFKSTSESGPESYERSIDHSPQAWGYCWGASEIMRIDRPIPVGIIYDVVYKKPPTRPEFLVCKKGPCTQYRKAQREGDRNGMDALRPKVEACGDCAGSGIIGLSCQATITTLALVDAALSELRALSPVGRAKVEAGEYEEYRAEVRRNEARFAYRIWKRPTAEHQRAFVAEAWKVAHEIGRKTDALTSRCEDHFLHMRGQCNAIARECEYIPICPAFGREALDWFERVPGSPGDPIELVEESSDEARPASRRDDLF